MSKYIRTALATHLGITLDHGVGIELAVLQREPDTNRSHHYVIPMRDLDEIEQTVFADMSHLIEIAQDEATKYRAARDSQKAAFGWAVADYEAARARGDALGDRIRDAVEEHAPWIHHPLRTEIEAAIADYRTIQAPEGGPTSAAAIQSYEKPFVDAVRARQAEIGGVDDRKGACSPKAPTRAARLIQGRTLAEQGLAANDQLDRIAAEPVGVFSRIWTLKLLRETIDGHLAALNGKDPAQAVAAVSVPVRGRAALSIRSTADRLDRLETETSVLRNELDYLRAAIDKVGGKI